MPKPQDIFQLAQQEAVRVTASPQAWQSFLYTAAHNYHTTYLNQLLIHAQRPDAAACASMEYWNTKANRLVMRGSRSITVLQRRQGMAVTKPIFTIGDTTLLSQTRTGGPWEVTDTTRPLLLQGKPDDWLSALAQEGVSNEADRARRMLERNVADSTLQWAQPDEQMQLLQALVTQSAVYMALLRIGLPVRDEDFPAFQSASQFDTYQISLCLGGYVQAAAEPMLNAIGREALRLNRDSIAIPHEPVHNESTPTQLDSREEAVTHDVHEEPRRLPDSEPFPAEPAEPVSEPLREAASGISGAERADALRPADAGGHAADELQSNRTSRTADGGQNSARADADHPDAGPQDEPTGLDADDQQPEKAGGGSSPSDAVRSLTEAPAEAESEQALSAFSLPEFSPTLLPQLLAAETSSRASNAEYLTFYNKNPLLIDRLRFVRESYKDIFTELLLADDTRVGFHRQDNGLLVWQGAYLTRSAETLLPWRTVIKQDQYGNAYAGNAVTARFTKTVTLPPGAAGFKGWYENGADTYGNVEWASLLYRMDWEALYGVADGIKCRSVGSALTADELQALLAGLNIDPDTARGQVVAFAISCQGHFVYGQPSSLRGGPGNASVGMNLDCSSFVQYCYWAQGLPFAAGNTASYGRTSDLQAISSAEVQPGDLRVVYAAGGEQGHVQMALGGGAWIECCYCYGVCVNMSNAWILCVAVRRT